MNMSGVKVEIDEKELFKQTLRGNTRDTLQYLSAAIDDIIGLRHRIVKQAWPSYDWMVHRTSRLWDCDKSPAGVCIYNTVEDPTLDNCIFCHQPSERK